MRRDRPHGRRTPLVGLVAVAMLIGLAAPVAARPDKPPKVDFTLTVLHNNDGESDLLPDGDGAGSISRYGWLFQDLEFTAKTSGGQARSKTGVISIGAGDNFLASPELQASFSKGVPWYDSIALDYLDYDAFVIGNHEFDFGPEVLSEFIAGFEGGDDVFLSANLDFSAEPELQALVDAGTIRPSIVVKERGERIGIIGLTTPELREVSSPGDVIIDADLVSVAQAEVDRLTAEGIDKILVASHLQDIDNELELVTQLENVDAVIGGGGGEDISGSYPLVATDLNGVEVPVVTVPGDYFDVGRLVLQFDRDGNVVDFGGALEPVTGDLPQDQFLLQNVEEPIAEFLTSLAETVIATSEVGINGIRADVRSRETNGGNLMADAHLAAAQARAADFGAPAPQVALQNGGGIRNDSIIGPGNITLLDTFDMAPFANFISILDPIAVEDFVAAVEHGLIPAGSFGQWSGLEVVFDPGAAPGSQIVDLTLDDGTVIVSDGEIVSSDPVTIATIDFLAAGNDGYDMFEAYDFTTVGISYQQSLADYLIALGTVTDAEYSDPVDPADRTRIIPVP